MDPIAPPRIRGGVRSGLEALEHDPTVALVAEASPTTLALGRMLGAMALAVVPVLAVVLSLGRMLTRRMGPAFPDDDEPGAAAPDDEPIADPWEEGEPSP